MIYFLFIVAAALVGFLAGFIVVNRSCNHLILADDALIKAQDDLINKLKNRSELLNKSITAKDQLIAAQKELINSNPQLANMIKEYSKGIN